MKRDILLCFIIGDFLYVPNLKYVCREIKVCDYQDKDKVFIPMIDQLVNKNKYESYSSMQWLILGLDLKGGLRPF